MHIPEYTAAKQYYISPEGLQHILATPRDPNFPGKNLLWTTDFKTELPIRLGTTGVSASKPTTLIEDFRNSV
jgi:long-chain-fatty-acid--CoA ligase ACSBG